MRATGAKGFTAFLLRQDLNLHVVRLTDGAFRYGISLNENRSNKRKKKIGAMACRNRTG